MKQKSIWLEEKRKESYPSIDRDIKLDCLIIGGGITGISLLYQLKEKNMTVALVERARIAEGVTAKSTAKLNFLQGIVYSKIAKEVSKKSARMYLKSQLEGIELIKNIIEKEKIACDLEKVTSYLYGEEKEKTKIEEEYQFLKKNHVPVEKQGNTLKVSDTYVFHPVKYVRALAQICYQKKQNIYENSLVTELKKEKDHYIVLVNNHRILAKKVVLACHYPFELLPFFLPVRTYIEKSYIMTSPTAIKKEETFITTYPKIVSKRYYQNYEMILKGSHNICNKLDTKKNFAKLVGESKPEYVWSNEDIMTSDLLPFIGFMDKNLLLATGYNTWGMATSAIASILLKDILLESYNEYMEVFHPYRSFSLAKMKQYPINILSNMKSFIWNKIQKKKKWYPKDLSFSIRNGKPVAKYTFKEKEHMVYTTCPHMLCTLLFNEVEQTWDCPCHASRFDISGKCIKGPSAKDITYKENLPK